MVPYLVLLFWAVSLLVVSVKWAGGWAGPTCWFIAPWVLQLVLLLLPIFSYEDKLTFDGTMFVMTCLGVVVLGGLLAHFVPIRRSVSAQPRPVPLWILVASLAILGIIGQVLVFVDVSATGTLSLQERILGGAQDLIRSAHWQRMEEASGSNLAKLAFFLTPLTVVGVALYRSGYRFAPRPARSMSLTKWLVYVGAAMLLFNAFYLEGGRFNLVFMTLLLVASHSLCVRVGAIPRPSGGRKLGRRVRTATLSLAAGVLALYLATSFITNRMGATNTTWELLLYKGHRATFTPQAERFMAIAPGVAPLLYSVSYFSTSIPTLAYYLELSRDEWPGPFHGLYSFPLLGIVQSKLQGYAHWDSWNGIRQELFTPLTSAGFAGNVWATVIRDLIADFRLVGTVVFLLCGGFVASILFRYAVLGRRPEALAAVAVMNTGLGMSALVNTLFIPVFYMSLGAALLVWLAGVASAPVARVARRSVAEAHRRHA